MEKKGGEVIEREADGKQVHNGINTAQTKPENLTDGAMQGSTRTRDREDGMEGTGLTRQQLSSARNSFLLGGSSI